MQGSKRKRSEEGKVGESQDLGFILEEKEGDLFSCPTSASLAHCVSQDFMMGKGIALTFRLKFGGVGKLRKQLKQIGQAALLYLSGEERYVYYLVTKELYWNKPRLDSLEKALIDMRIHAIGHSVNHICMPRIGCGLDKLQWSDVKNILRRVFCQSGITISIYVPIEKKTFARL